MAVNGSATQPKPDLLFESLCRRALPSEIVCQFLSFICKQAGSFTPHRLPKDEALFQTACSRISLAPPPSSPLGRPREQPTPYLAADPILGLPEITKWDSEKVEEYRKLRDQKQRELAAKLPPVKPEPVLEIDTVGNLALSSRFEEPERESILRALASLNEYREAIEGSSLETAVECYLSDFFTAGEAVLKARWPPQIWTALDTKIRFAARRLQVSGVQIKVTPIEIARIDGILLAKPPKVQKRPTQSDIPCAEAVGQMHFTSEPPSLSQQTILDAVGLGLKTGLAKQADIKPGNRKETELRHGIDSNRFISNADFFDVAYCGKEALLKQTNGLHYIQKMLQQPAQNFWVSELEGAVSDNAVRLDDILEHEEGSDSENPQYIYKLASPGSMSTIFTEGLEGDEARRKTIWRARTIKELVELSPEEFAKCSGPDATLVQKLKDLEDERLLAEEIGDHKGARMAERRLRSTNPRDRETAGRKRTPAHSEEYQASYPKHR